MKSVRKTIWAVLVFVLLLDSFNVAKASDDSPNNGVAYASLFSYGALVLFDIVSTPLSVKRYNDRVAGLFPVRPNYPPDFAARRSFGPAKFSRAALAKPLGTPVYYRVNPRRKRSKSPDIAFLWSLGATVVPFAVGVKIANGSNTSTSDKIAGALLIYSMTLGPSTGHFYAKQFGRGMLTALLRVGFGLLFLATYDYGPSD
ncbi:MAG: hypothetical protein ACE5HO_18050 [bacterium]